MRLSIPSVILAIALCSCQISQPTISTEAESERPLPMAKRGGNGGGGGGGGGGDGGTVDVDFRITATGDLSGQGSAMQRISESNNGDANLTFGDVILAPLFLPEVNGGVCGQPTLPTQATIGPGNKKSNRDRMGMLYSFFATGADGGAVNYNLQLWGARTAGDWLPGTSATVVFDSWELKPGRKNKTACSGNGSLDATVVVDRLP